MARADRSSAVLFAPGSIRSFAQDGFLDLLSQPTGLVDFVRYDVQVAIHAHQALMNALVEGKFVNLRPMREDPAATAEADEGVCV
jgi:hypothetical protein